MRRNFSGLSKSAAWASRSTAGWSPRGARNDRAATIATKRVFRAPRADHPAVDLEAQAALFESPEKFRRMTEFLERKPK